VQVGSRLLLSFILLAMSEVENQVTAAGSGINAVQALKENAEKEVPSEILPAEFPAEFSAAEMKSNDDKQAVKDEGKAISAEASEEEAKGAKKEEAIPAKESVEEPKATAEAKFDADAIRDKARKGLEVGATSGELQMLLQPKDEGKGISAVACEEAAKEAKKEEAVPAKESKDAEGTKTMEEALTQIAASVQEIAEACGQYTAPVNKLPVSASMSIYN